MTTRPAPVQPVDGPLSQRLAIVRDDHDRKHEPMDGVSLGWCWRKGRGREIPNTVKCDTGLLLTALDQHRAKLLDRLRRVHYPPQIGTHYEQGFADCLRAVLAEFERP